MINGSSNEKDMDSSFWHKFARNFKTGLNGLGLLVLFTVQISEPKPMFAFSI